MARVAVDRAQVLAYRVAAQGLDTRRDDITALSVLDLGIQDTPPGTMRAALAARLDPAAVSTTLDDSLAMAWTHRGAPHLHRRADLPALAKALWPLSERDAYIRMTAVGAILERDGVGGRAALTEMAKTMRAVAKKPIAKGDLSGAVQKKVSTQLVGWCHGCQVHHVYDQLFRLAALPAGLEIDPEQTPLTFMPIKGARAPAIPAKNQGTESVVSTYLRLLGPATEADVALFIGTKPTEIRGVWPDGLVEVDVDGRRGFLPEEAVGSLTDATPVKGTVRLLPPADPFLQARDRDLLLPDKAKRTALWGGGILNRAGAVLAGGDIAGLWKSRLKGKTLAVEVIPFRSTTAAAKKVIEAEAAGLAAARGASSARVSYDTA